MPFRLRLTNSEILDQIVQHVYPSSTPAVYKQVAVIVPNVNPFFSHPHPEIITRSCHLYKLKLIIVVPVYALINTLCIHVLLYKLCYLLLLVLLLLLLLLLALTYVCMYYIM